MNFLDKILDMMQEILPCLAVYGVFKLMAKRNAKKIDEVYEQEKEDEYIITNHKELLWIFAIGTVFSLVMLCMAFVYDQAEIWVVAVFLTFAIASLIGALNSVIWKVEVKGDCIEYRSTFGITRRYNFNEITRGVYKASGAMRVYAGKKRIFTFDDNVIFLSFEMQMIAKGIPIIEYRQNQDGNFVVRPATVYYVISSMGLIFMSGLTVLIFLQTNQWTILHMAMIGLTLCFGIPFLDFVMDRAWVKDGIFHRRRLFKKTVHIPVSDISQMKLKKNLFRENLVLYQGGKRIASVWTINPGATWLQAKIGEEKRKKKKKK